MTTRSTGGSSIGSSGLGSSGIGSSGIGSTGIGSTGIGSTGIGSTGIGSTGIGSTGIGSTGLGSSSLGSTSLGGSSGGSFSGNLGSSSLGSVNRSFGGGQGYGGGFGYGGGSGTASLSGVSAATYGGVSTSNLFANYYGNPMASGLGSSGAQSRFGSPLYQLSTATTNIGLTGTAGISSTNMYSNNSLGASYGGRRVVYVPDIGRNEPRPSPPAQLQLRTDLQQVLARSSSLPSKESIQVMTDGNVIVLRGTVADEREKRLAESLLRLTPGVRQISNELEVSR
jgi:hypothetical protein